MTMAASDSASKIIESVDSRELSTYYDNPVQSNMTIVSSDGREFRAHKAIVIAAIPRLGESIHATRGGRIELSESGAVVERVGPFKLFLWRT